MHDTTDGVSIVIQAREGKFIPHQRNGEVILHGAQKKPVRITLDDKPIEAVYEDRAGKVQKMNRQR